MFAVVGPDSIHLHFLPQRVVRGQDLGNGRPWEQMMEGQLEGAQSQWVEVAVPQTAIGNLYGENGWGIPGQ